MKIRMRTNLGRVDAKALGLACEEFTYESVHQVADDVGESLVKRGFAELIEKTVKAVAKPVELKAPAKHES